MSPSVSRREGRGTRPWVAVAAAIGVLVASALAAPGAIAAPQGEDPQTLERAGIPLCPAREIEVQADEASWIPLDCEGLDDVPVRIVKRPGHGTTGQLDQAQDRVLFRPDPGYVGRSHLVAMRKRSGREFRTSVRIDVNAAGGGEGRNGGPAPVATSSEPDCRDHHAITRFGSPVAVRIRCHGVGLEHLQVVTGPFCGRLKKVHRKHKHGGEVHILTARFHPGPGKCAQDAMVVDASTGDQASYGSIGVSVLPWRMRVIGDSVTAAFGFYGDGSPMQAGDVFNCRPPDAVNNRCSSNSDQGPGYSGPPSWSRDFGLANNISWAAQFANMQRPHGNVVTAPEMFQNHAVTGSAPTDWLPGGAFNPQLQSIISENPELIAMTMGANPLLSTILFTFSGEACAVKHTVNDLIDCIRPLFTNVDLAGNLQRLYLEILSGAPKSKVVVFQYSLSDPQATLFNNWQVETMIDFFNQQIATAVAGARASLPKNLDPSRLIMIQAQTEPGNPQPDQLARFNLGIPPTPEQTWTPTFDCGTGPLVDGPSHQSAGTQSELSSVTGFCSGDPWIINTDTGIHPNAEGYRQYANALNVVAQQNGLVP